MKKNIIILALLLLIIGCAKNLTNHTLTNNNKITAAFNFGKVESLAKTYSKDLMLHSIHSDNVDFKGYAQKWTYIYSSETDSDYCFYATLKKVEFDSTLPKNIGSTFVSSPWFDSNKALGIAEKNGGEDFRLNNLEYKIEASLAKPVVPNSATFWYITYRSKSDKTKRLMLGIDARSGEVTLKYP